MNEDQLKEVASQLRQPHGDYAREVGRKMNEGNALLNRRVIDLLRPFGKEQILEIGMGNGFFVKEILSNHSGITYAGCDFSKEMVEEATFNNELFVKSGQAVFYHAEATDLPLQDESVHKIFTINTIYFWDDPSVVFAELRRVLKPNGAFVIGIRPRRTMQTYPFTKFGFTMYDQKELCDLIEKNGFSVRQVVEEAEPDQLINGNIIKVDMLITVAVKN